MAYILARTYRGAIDLYNGIPDLLNATIEDVEYDNSNGDYRTILNIRDIKGNIHMIEIANGN